MRGWLAVHVLTRRSVTAAKLQDCRDTARAVLRLLQRNIRARDIATRKVHRRPAPPRPHGAGL